MDIKSIGMPGEVILRVGRTLMSLVSMIDRVIVNEIIFFLTNLGEVRTFGCQVAALE